MQIAGRWTDRGAQVVAIAALGALVVLLAVAGKHTARRVPSAAPRALRAPSLDIWASDYTSQVVALCSGHASDALAASCQTDAARARLDALEAPPRTVHRGLRLDDSPLKASDVSPGDRILLYQDPSIADQTEALTDRAKRGLGTFLGVAPQLEPQPRPR